MNDSIEKSIKKITADIDLKSQFFWDISDTDIQKFKNNFSKYSSNAGLYLLDMMIYYNSTHCNELTTSAIYELKRNIWLNAQHEKHIFKNSNEIKQYVDTYLSQSFVFPVSNKDESGTSSEMLEGYYRSSSDFVPVNNYKSLNTLTEIIAAKKPKSIIFVDDIIGTGKQFSKFYSKYKHFYTDITIADCVENNPNIDFYYLVFAADKIAYSNLCKEFPALKIIAVELFEDNDQVTNKNNEYWEFYDAYDAFMRDIEKIGKDFPRECRFSLDLPILYVSGRAQNTSFEYFWNDYDSKWDILKVR